MEHTYPQRNSSGMPPERTELSYPQKKGGSNEGNYCQEVEVFRQRGEAAGAESWLCKGVTIQASHEAAQAELSQTEDDAVGTALARRGIIDY